MAGTFNPGGLNAPPKSIINFSSAGGAAAVVMGTNEVFGTSKFTLSGALTAATYKEILSVSGPGVICMAFVCGVDVTARTVGIKIIIDGTTIFDASCASTATRDAGVHAIGHNAASELSGIQPVCFNSSLSISIKSSLSETDLIGLGHVYYTT